jgi:hypothetical protein
MTDSVKDLLLATVDVTVSWDAETGVETARAALRGADIAPDGKAAVLAALRALTEQLADEVHAEQFGSANVN